MHELTPESDEYLIDLQHTHDVNLIKLAFCDYDKIAKLRVQIWSILEKNSICEQQLLVSKTFNDSEGVWLQVTKHAHEPSLIKYFTDSEQLSQLGFKVETRSRYLLIQVTYSFRAGIPSLLKDTQSKKAIMPVVIGNPIVMENDSIDKLVKRFDVKSSVTFKNSVAVSSWLSYDKFDGIPDSPNQFLYEPSAKDNIKDENVMIKDSEYDVSALIASLQGELYNLLYSQRNPNFFFQNQEKVYDICNSIQDAQIKLHNLTHDKEGKATEGHPTLSIYLTLIESLSQFVIKILGTQTSTPVFSSEQIFELFDSILLFEPSNYFSSLHKLVESYSWAQIEEKKQQEVISKIFSTYLMKSNSIIDAPVGQLYSPFFVLQFLINILQKNIQNISVFLDFLGEKSSLVGYTYSLIIINEIYLSIIHDSSHLNLPKPELNQAVLNTLFRNLHFLIDSPEHSETEKNYLIAFIMDIIFNVAYLIPSNEISILFQSPIDMFRVFHYVAKHNLNEASYKLIKILNLSAETLKDSTSNEKDSRIRALINRKTDHYCSFVLESLRSLVDFARFPEKKHLFLDKFGKEITADEWRALLRVIISHFQLLLEADRKDQSAILKKELKLKKKEKIES